MRIKTDERAVLHAVQAGEPIEAAAAAVKMNPNRLAYIVKKWTQAGMMDADGKLTPKGLAADWLHSREQPTAPPAEQPPDSGQLVDDEETDGVQDIPRRGGPQLDPPHDRGEGGGD